MGSDDAGDGERDRLVEDGPRLHHGGAEQADHAEAEGVARDHKVRAVLGVETADRRVSRVLLGPVHAAVADRLVRVGVRVRVRVRARPSFRIRVRVRVG